MSDRILVPLDASAFAEHALAAAVDLARASGARLRLVTAYRPLAPDVLDGGGRPWVADYLDETAKSALERLPGRVDARVVEGSAVDVVLGEAASWGADLIVMSTHGRGAIGRATLGSVADEVMRRAGRPVLVVRPGRGPGTIDMTEACRRVVVPLDGSEVSEAALGPALSFARQWEGRVELLRVIPDPLPPASPYAPTAVEASRLFMETARAGAEAALQQLAQNLSRDGVAVTGRVVVDPSPARAILSHAAGCLIVMATHGRGGLRRLFLGSVTSEVVEELSGPALIVPPSVGRAGADIGWEARIASAPAVRA